MQLAQLLYIGLRTTITDVCLSPSLLFPWVKAMLSALLVPSDYCLKKRMQCFILQRNLVKKW